MSIWSSRISSAARFVRESNDVSPLARVPANKLGKPIRTLHIRVTINREMIVVVRCQQRKNESPDRMLAEIRRNVSDPQFPLGIAIIGVRLNKFLERLGMLLVPAAVFLENRAGIEAGMKMQGVDQIAVRGCKIRLEPE